MEKISLNLDALLVESFDTTSDMEQPRGTVRGAEASEATDCLFTCGHSCEVTCGDSCHGSCIGETCEITCIGVLTDD